MKTIKRVIALNDLTDNITKDKVYKVKYIHYGQTVYYDVIDDNGKKSTHRADDFIDTKQVVINEDDARVSIIPSLTPYWTVELFKRKGKILYAYDWDYDKNDDSYYELIDVNSCKEFKKIYHIAYSYEKIERRILDSSDLIDEYSLFDEISREDKDLIAIVKEINNKKVIKIVDIPFDVDYYIEDGQCGFAETICEIHRKWY